MREKIISKEGQLLKLLNQGYYLFRRNNWMIDPRRILNNFNDVPLNKPIFLLGTQGGGLTLVSRMLRRHKDVVSVTGNCDYWAGADEMTNVLEQMLIPSLTGTTFKVSPDELFGTTKRGSIYATDKLLSEYRRTDADASPGDRQTFQKTLRWLIKRYSKGNKQARFIDKSQLFTVKMSYLNALLDGCDPFFVLVTRNPYALCYSRAKTGSLLKVADRYDFSQRLEYSAQHWANSIACTLEDESKVQHFMTVQFEEILQRPEKKLNEICHFLGLEYSDDMVPRAEHLIPFGSMRRDRWYPMRPQVNDKHLREMQPEHVEIIARYCEPYAEQFGYEKPQK